MQGADFAACPHLPAYGLVVLKPLDVCHRDGDGRALQPDIVVLNDGDIMEEVGIVNLWWN